MNADKQLMFENRLTKMYRHLSRQAQRQGITCYRVYDHDLPEFPFCIERYEDKLYIAEYQRRHGMEAAAHTAWLEACIAVMCRVLGVNKEAVFVKQRKRKLSRQEQYEKLAAEQQTFVVQEAGLQFRVNLSDYLDTGLFLDHRITRGLVREQARGKRVLNLFCYTGAFSVYAAAGGAAEVVSVDLSNTYLRWAEENMRLNGLYDPGKHRFERADVKQYLPTLAPAYFDLVVLDPPTFSNSKGMKDFLDIQRDHVPLLQQTLRVLRKGGWIYFSTNFRKFVLEQDLLPATGIKDLTNATTPFDFRGKLLRRCFLIQK